MRVFQREQEGQRDQRAHSLDLLQQGHLRITLLHQRSNSVVVLADPFVQLFDRRQQRLQCPLQFRTQPFSFLRIHIAHIAAAQSFSVRLR